MKVYIQNSIMGKDVWLLGLLSTKVGSENLRVLDILTFGQLFSGIWEKQGPNI